MARYDCIAVYIMASAPNGTLYIGVTSDLMQRVYQHRQGELDGFTKKYGCKTLVWFEQYEDMYAAIAREKDIKKWRRVWKLRLIEQANPQWRDLYEDFIGLPRGVTPLALDSGLSLRDPRNPARQAQPSMRSYSPRSPRNSLTAHRPAKNLFNPFKSPAHSIRPHTGGFRGAPKLRDVWAAVGAE